MQTEELAISREPLNGTFVLATQRDLSYIVAYFALTERIRGTFLVKADDSGQVNMVLEPVKTPGISEAYYKCRVISGRIFIEPYGS